MARPDGEHASNIRIVGETGWSSSLESVQQTLWVHHWAKIKGNFWGGRRNFKYSVVAATRSQSVFTDLPLQQYRGGWGMWFSFPKGVFWTLSKQRANEKPFRNWFFFFFLLNCFHKLLPLSRTTEGAQSTLCEKGRFFIPSSPPCPRNHSLTNRNPEIQSWGFTENCEPFKKSFQGTKVRWIAPGGAE